MQNETHKRVEVLGFEALSFEAQALLFDWFRRVREEDPDFEVLLVTASLSAPDLFPGGYIFMSEADKIRASLSSDKKMLETIEQAAQEEAAELLQ